MFGNAAAWVSFQSPSFVVPGHNHQFHSGRVIFQHLGHLVAQINLLLARILLDHRDKSFHRCGHLRQTR